MTPAVPEPVARLLRAANDNDVDAFLAGFTDDGVDDWGREREVAQDGATTVVTAQVGGDGFNGPSHFSFEVEGDRVARMTIRA